MTPPFVIMGNKDITTSGMLELITAMFSLACSDYSVAYYNTHFDFQEYRDQRELYENEDFILHSDLLSLIFSDEERYNILVKLREKVVTDHAIFRYGKNGDWKVMPSGKRARYV